MPPRLTVPAPFVIPLFPTRVILFGPPSVAKVIPPVRVSESKVKTALVPNC